MQTPSVSVMLRSWDVRVGTTGEMVLDAARRAENLGLDGIIAGDHVTFYGYGNDGLVMLTAAAAVTANSCMKECQETICRARRLLPLDAASQ